MIGFLSGVVLEYEAGALLLDVQGVGYELSVPQELSTDGWQKGDQLRLYVHQVVREDALDLYGFVSATEKSLFRLLLKINGVGPRMALSILSQVSLDELVQMVQTKDLSGLLRVKGVGKKLAEKLLFELSNRLSSLLPVVSGLCVSHPDASRSMALQGLRAPACAALEKLGYQYHEFSSYLEASVAEVLPDDLSGLIRQVLIKLSVAKS